MTTTRREDRIRALWAAQLLLAGIDKELRKVGYCAEMDEFARPIEAWVVEELKFWQAHPGGDHVRTSPAEG